MDKALEEQVSAVAAELAGSMVSDRFKYDQAAREDVVRLVVGTVAATTYPTGARGYVAANGMVALDAGVLANLLAEGRL